MGCMSSKEIALPFCEVKLHEGHWIELERRYIYGDPKLGEKKRDHPWDSDISDISDVETLSEQSGKSSVGEVHLENRAQRYRVQTISDFRAFRKFATSEDGWTHHYQTQNPVLKVQSGSDPTGKLTVTRVYREMPDVDPRALYDTLHDANYRRTWDTNMLDGSSICILSAHNDIGYYSAKMPWPLADRKFRNMRAWMEFTNGDYAIYNHSVAHSPWPEYKAKNHLTGFYVQPCGAGASLTYVTHSNLGPIPKLLTDPVLTHDVPDLLQNIETCALRYVSWSKNHYLPGHAHSWTTPKMDWDCTTMNYPQQEQKEAEKQSLKEDTTRQVVMAIPMTQNFNGAVDIQFDPELGSPHFAQQDALYAPPEENRVAVAFHDPNLNQGNEQGAHESRHFENLDNEAATVQEGHNGASIEATEKEPEDAAMFY
eukprot:GILI01008271.1.p1 GENE.GILI01008271.1~~GILI01008271.1.p1  ORF type:complete len:426 (-),score=33.62 GILI01008271.1:183-1460(-)